jgi:hypothetical protein
MPRTALTYPSENFAGKVLPLETPSWNRFDCLGRASRLHPDGSASLTMWRANRTRTSCRRQSVDTLPERSARPEIRRAGVGCGDDDGTAHPTLSQNSVSIGFVFLQPAFGDNLGAQALRYPAGDDGRDHGKIPCGRASENPAPAPSVTKPKSVQKQFTTPCRFFSSARFKTMR